MRPLIAGVIAAFGVIHREFTIYGVGVILAMAILDGAWRRRESWFAFGRGLAAAAGVYVVVAFLRQFSSALGPGTGTTVTPRWTASPMPTGTRRKPLSPLLAKRFSR